jgi:hypothetical protein
VRERKKREKEREREIYEERVENERHRWRVI